MAKFDGSWRGCRINGIADSEASVDLWPPTEGSHNGIAAVLKTAGFAPVGVRVPRPPL